MVDVWQLIVFMDLFISINFQKKIIKITTNCFSSSYCLAFKPINRIGRKKLNYYATAINIADLCWNRFFLNSLHNLFGCYLQKWNYIIIRWFSISCTTFNLLAMKNKKKVGFCGCLKRNQALKIRKNFLS